MKEKLLVSLVSGQTIPNVQLIKEVGGEAFDYLFITTKGMEALGVRRWIEGTCAINDALIVEVSQFSFDDIKEKLNGFDFERYSKIVVNITGGTKVMTLVAYEYFKNIGADIFYVTGENEEYLKLFPGRKSAVLKFSTKLTIQEYLKSHGFTCSSTKPSGISYETTKKLFLAFCEMDRRNHVEAFSFLHTKREKVIAEEEYYKVESLLKALNYQPIQEGVLSRKETKYLTGEWFEEYVGYRLKEELGLSDDELLIGQTIKKELPSKKRNDTNLLLGEDVKSKEVNPNNEMDVMFVYNNRFYTIECKTSINSFRNGKPYNILHETIYKSDSLRSRFGLFANTTIMTLTDFSQYCHVADKEKKNNRTNEMKGLINRANLSGIKLIDKSMLRNASAIFDLIK